MDVFDLRGNLVFDYRDYVRSFIKIRDPRIGGFVDGFLDAEGFWPEPLLQINPTFRAGGTVDDLVEEGVLHSECSRIFRIDKSETDHVGRQLLLHQHQRDAILKAKEGRSYVLIRLREDPRLHRADRGPRDSQRVRPRHPGHRRLPDERACQQPERGAREVRRTGLPGRRAPGSLRPLHRAGEGRRSRHDSGRPARHPSHQLHDAGASAHAKRGPRAGASGPGASSSSSSTSSIPTAGARAPTSRCSFDVAATPSATTSCASAHPRPWRAAEAATSRRSRWRRRCSASRGRPAREMRMNQR